MIQKNSNYIYGSAAEKVKYDVYEENKVLRQVKIKRNNKKKKTQVVVMLIIAFAICFFVMLRYAVITELNYSIDKTNKIYNEIKNENLALKINMEKETDLNKVREVAENSLSMQKPDRYQIVYVNVPKNDFTKLPEINSKSSAEGNNLFAGVFQKVGEFSQLFY